MPRRNYEAEAIHEECLIHPGIVLKVKGEDAFLIDMRVLGAVEINGKRYVYNDVMSCKFQRQEEDE